MYRGTMSFTEAEKAEAAVIGHVMMLSITIIGISTVTLYGLPAISSLEDMANSKIAEQSFNLFDSSASRAILGDSIETMDMNLGGGTLTIEPNGTGKESYITIKQGNNLTKVPMGKVVYRLGDRVAAYEGGGAWSKSSISSTMISPPSFNYNGITLTLPVMSIRGNGSAGGKGLASVSFKKGTTTVIYPNASSNSSNPVNDDVYVNITSDFYEAWANYAKRMSYTQVETDSTTKTASIKLMTTSSTIGQISSITDPFTLRGLNASNSTPVSNFSFRLFPYGDSLDWDIRASSGKQKLIFHIKGDAKHPGNKIDIKVGYQNDSYQKPAETWKGTDKLIVGGQEGNEYVDVDLLNKSIYLTYDNTDVGTGSSCVPDKVRSSDFNSSGFSWPNTNSATQYKWYFNSDTESWVPTAVSGVTYGFNAFDGNTSGSIYAKRESGGGTKTATWTSPNFVWTGGTPTSARLEFDWKVATYGGTPGTLTAKFYRADGSIYGLGTIASFSSSTGWSKLVVPIPAAYLDWFGYSGNYTLELSAGLGGSPVEVRWDNPTIILDTGSDGSLSTKSLFDITQHYIQLMAQEGDVSFYQCNAPGKGIEAVSNMYVNYGSTKAPTYLFVAEDIADVSID